VFQSGTPDKKFEDLLYLILGVELLKAGFSSTKVSEKSDYVLMTDYKLKDQEAEVCFRLYNAKNPEKPLAEQKETWQIDYSLESQVSKAVQSLITHAGIGSRPEKEPVIEGVLAESPKVEQADVPISAEPPKQPDRETIGRTEPYFETSLGLGGIMLLGDITKYVHYGITGSLKADIMFPKDGYSVAAGIRITSSRMFNNSGVEGGPLLISTIGPNVQFGTSLRMPYYAAIAVSGGAAVLSILEGTPLHKTVPYVDIGIHARIPVGKGFFTGADVRYLLVFDSDILIMGIVPGLFMGKEI